MKTTNWICLSAILPFVYALPGLAKRSENATAPVSQTTCNGRKYTYEALAGYGSLQSDFRDKLGDTLGGASSLAFEPSSWKKTGQGKYEGVIFVLPDRGW
jgi:hypothetical protein